MKRTIDGSPPIHRWDRDVTWGKSPCSGRLKVRARTMSAVRFTDYIVPDVGVTSTEVLGYFQPSALRTFLLLSKRNRERHERKREDD